MRLPVFSLDQRIRAHVHLLIPLFLGSNSTTRLPLNSGSPADRPDCDEVLEINGRSLENATHQHIIQYIHQVEFHFSFHELRPKSPALCERQWKRESSLPPHLSAILRPTREIHDVIVFFIRAKDFLIIIILFSCFAPHFLLLALVFRSILSLDHISRTHLIASSFVDDVPRFPCVLVNGVNIQTQQSNLLTWEKTNNGLSTPTNTPHPDDEMFY